MLTKCNECGRDVSDTVSSCPHCGYIMTAAQPVPLGDDIAMPLASANNKMKQPAAPLALSISVIAVLATFAAPKFLVAMPLIISASSAVISIFRGEKWRWGALIILALCLYLFTWAAGLGSPTGTAGKDVTYTVSGTATSASITYQNEGGGTSQVKVTLPWTHVIHSPSSNFLYISAQNEGQFGDISCEIKVDDNIVKTSTSSGAYTIVSCSN